MTSTFIRLFSSLNTKDTAEAGGKGANLGELTRAGFPVPPGFVVTARTYNDFFASLGLEKELDRLAKARTNESERYCALIREAITSTELPAFPSEAILNAHEQLVQAGGMQAGGTDLLCVVRSSATTEDLQDASFAGQHGTYYYVDQKNLLRMIRLCWASLWNAEAVSYRLAHGIEHAAAQMAVVVQEMIRADVSGITFTVNPVSGAEEIVTESSWGMGAAIVDGRVTPDRYILDRNTLQQRERRIACKRFMVSSNLRAGAESRLEEIPPDMQQQETLPPDHLNTVATWAVRAEEHFGSPQDLEWAIAGDAFYLLQSRPVTAIGFSEQTNDPDGQYVLFKPYLENLTEPLTPMTADLLSRSVFPVCRLIDGRAYLDLKFLRPLIPFRLADHELADLFYNLSIDIHLPLQRISLLKLFFLFLLLCYEYLTFGVLFARTRNLPDNFMDCFRTLCREVENDPTCGPQETLLQLWLLPKFFDQIGNMPLWVNFSAARYIFIIGPLKNLVRHWLPDAPPDTVPRLCSGQKKVLSTEMGREIKELAEEADRYEPVRDLLLQCPTDQVPTKLRQVSEAEHFLRLFEQFLAKHGHRAVRELELQSPRWGENPAQVIGMIRNYLLTDAGQKGPKKRSKNIPAQSRAELTGKLRQQLERLPLERLFRPRQRLLNFLITQARYLIKLRENSRFYHIMGLSFVRKKLLSLERDFLAQGVLKCKDDIFFLHLDEVRSMQNGELRWPDVEKRLRRRRLERARLTQKSPGKTVGIDVPENLQQEESPAEDRAVLYGQSASPGYYEGIARVILDPGVDAELQPGEILVAPYTDPAWTPLFLTAGAAVVEVGSYLSHAGTVAREYGLPCVVDVGECTKRIRSGARLSVDGDQGIVHILTEPPAAAYPQKKSLRSEKTT
jgi:pyruvate,water dikinase